MKSVERGAAAGSHWASRWIAALESLNLARRIERGKRYARSGRVLEIEITSGGVEARVQGSRYEPYRVRIRFKEFTARQWQRAIEALASQALFAAKLLSGEMPPNIEEAFQSASLSLFPSTRRDLDADCSCPDGVNPCKHIAAVHYVLSDHFDKDPFLLFRLRGRDRGEILKALRARRAAEASGETVVSGETPPLEQSLERFWTAGTGLDALSVTVSPPAVTASLMKRLGVPEFWRSHPEIRGSLERLYAKVTERAMALAYGGQGIEPSGPASPGETGTKSA